MEERQVLTMDNAYEQIVGRSEKKKTRSPTKKRIENEKQSFMKINRSEKQSDTRKHIYGKRDYKQNSR